MPSDANPGRSAPRRIGHYRIVRELGHGGMGVVYEALQENPVRTVALKVVTAGVMGREALRRFELEAQVLGLLQHPGIAQIYEAGRTDEAEGGQPYFAMELVRGETLSDYATHRRLDLRQRLGLIAQVCDAVQHAHQRGVIHRDLKPGNILVDETGRTKVLDFGVARATDSDLRTATLQTDVGQLVGTIPYMSPEQASGDPSKLDTRSDVYALGVVAYELISGQLPYELDLRQVLEAVRVVRDQEARPLSSIDVHLRGDVETLIGKALQKEPGRRYESAAAFAEDIRRYLDDQPISARPPSAIYQLSKFARRNKALVGGMLGIFLALVAGLVGTSLGYVEAERKRVEADQATQAAQVSALQARKTSEFLSTILEGIDPAEAQGLDTTLMRRILADTEQRIETELTDLPRVAAEIHGTIGRTYIGLNDPVAAEPHLRRALELRSAELDPDDPALLEPRLQVGLALRMLNRFDEAEPILRAVSAEAHARLGPLSPVTLQADQDLSVLYFDTDRLDECEAQLLDLLARIRQVPDYSPMRYVNTGLTYSTLLLQQGRAQEALDWLAELHDYSREHLGVDHPWTLRARINSASAEDKLGDFRRAEEIFTAVIADSTRVNGPDHLTTRVAMQNYAGLLRGQGRYGEAEPLLAHAAQAAVEQLGPRHTEALAARLRLAELWVLQGRYPQAEAEILEILDTYREVLGPDHRTTCLAKAKLARLYRILKRYDEAEPLLLAVLACVEVGRSFDPMSAVFAKSDLAVVYAGQGRFDQAVDLQRQVCAETLALLGPDHRDTLIARSTVAFTLLTRGDHEQAAREFLECLVDYRRVLGDAHTETLAVLYNTGACYKDWGQPERALPYYLEAAEGWQATLGPRHPSSLAARKALFELFAKLPSAELEEPWLRVQLELAREDLPPGDMALADALEALAHAQVRQEHGQSAIPLLEEALELRSGLGLEDPRMAWCQVLYGAALLFAERRDEAAELLPEAVLHLGSDSPQRTRDAQAWLARL